MTVEEIHRLFKAVEDSAGLAWIILLVASVLLLWMIPVLFAAVLIITAVPLVIGFYDTNDEAGSARKMVTVLFCIAVLSSPVFLGFIAETYRIDHADWIINRDDPEVLKLTEEFKQKMNQTDLKNPKVVLSSLEQFIYNEIKHSNWNVFFPTSSDAARSKSSDSRGRAAVAHAILKNLGYNTYITASFGGGAHAWVRIYDANTANESSPGEAFDEALTAAQKKEAWVVFNEENVYWSSPFVQVWLIFKDGFKVDSLQIFVLGNLLFLWPFWLIGISLLLFKGSYNSRNYLLMLTSFIAVVFASGSLGIFTLTVLPLPIMIGGGLYIRWLNKNLERFEDKKPAYGQV